LKDERRLKNGKVITFDGFSDYFSFFDNRFADSFFVGLSEGFGKSVETAQKERRSKMVYPDPGFYQVRDKEVQKGLVIFKG
jgi:hypothetical protein